MKGGRHLIFPVFCGVSPSEVRKQTGRYGEAFAKHEQIFRGSMEKVERWRTAMREVANLSGWDLNDRHESEAIQEIVEDILRKLSCSFSSIPEDLVGIDSRVEQLVSRLSLGLNDVRIVGICGMGGMGKTTIARVVFGKLLGKFERCSFLLNVREVHEKHGLVSSQEQLLDDILRVRNMKIWNVYQGIDVIRQRLCCKKVLVVLDDVDQLTQLESLAGSPDWFGAGSRIIITTRDEHVLRKHGVENIYKVTGLDHEESLQLLSLKAFNNGHPADNYMELSDLVVKYANGLPLALEILGSFLRGRSVKEWQSALSRLKENPNCNIMDKLQISFDGLENTEKRIFLDIACFFKGKEKDYVTSILDSCGFYPDIGISVLLEKSLITINSENLVLMHDLLEEMGREIVRRQSPLEPGNRTRLWHYKDAYHVLVNNTGTNEVEGLVLESPVEEEKCLSAKAFQRMRSIRLLKMQNVQFFEGPEYLSNELRSLELYKYPFKSLPSTFQPDNLVELNLPHSSIEQLWGKTQSFLNLKFVDLSYSKNLMVIDFKCIPHVEKLNLEGCTRLIEIHPSICVLKRLLLLNLRYCKNLMDLPSSICAVKSLKILNLYGCEKLEKLPENFGNLIRLVEVDVGKTGIRELPSSFYLLPDLKALSFQGCSASAPRPRNLSRQNMNSMALMLPSFSSLRSLKTLDVSYCNLKEGAVPNELSCLLLLEKLDLSGNDFVSIPASIGRIPKLKYIFLVNCTRLQSLPDLPSGLKFLNTDGCISMETIPNLCEGSTSKALWLTFTNCLKLAKGKISMGISWLKSYLLARCNQQGLLAPNYSCMSLPGSEIPEWFSSQTVGTSLRVMLPQGWCNQEWMGFAVCATFGHGSNSSSQLQTSTNDDESECFLVKCYLQGNNFPCYGVHLDVSKETNLTSDQLWLLFIPAAKYLRVRSVDWLNTRSHIEPVFSSDGLKVKKCGFRMVYRKDVEELIECRPTKNFNLLCQEGSLDGPGEHLRCKRLRMA